MSATSKIERFEPCEATLSDGTNVRFRAIDPADAPRLNAFHERLSTRTTWLRFFGVHPHLSPREVEWFTTVDHGRREAIVAVVDGEIIGVGRLDRVGDTDVAEVAFVVEDRWQDHGVGKLLLDHLAARARSIGYSTFVADTFVENGRMLHVFRGSGLGATSQYQDGVIHVTMPLASASQR